MKFTDIIISIIFFIIYTHFLVIYYYYVYKCIITYIIIYIIYIGMLYIFYYYIFLMLYIHILNDYKCTIIVIVLASSTYSVACITICCAILYILTKVSTVHVIIEFKGPLLLGWHHKNGEKKVKDPFGSYKTNQNSSHVVV